MFYETGAVGNLAKIDGETPVLEPFFNKTPRATTSERFSKNHFCY